MQIILDKGSARIGYRQISIRGFSADAYRIDCPDSLELREKEPVVDLRMLKRPTLRLRPRDVFSGIVLYASTV